MLAVVRVKLAVLSVLDQHTHPLHWNPDLQQFLLRHSEIPLDSCVYVSVMNIILEKPLMG